MTQKICKKCNLIKTLNDFALNKSAVDGHQPHCKPCGVKIQQEYKKRNPEKLKKRKADGYQKYGRNNNYLRKYGITLDDYNEMLLAQDCNCAICGTNQSKLSVALSVDHNHATGKVRKLLCQPCNVLLGCAKDNPETLRKAAQYLELI